MDVDREFVLLVLLRLREDVVEVKDQVVHRTGKK
jgi:hypothetical protein